MSSLLGRNKGNKAIGTMAKELEQLRKLAGRFSMGRYNGHAFVSPEKLVTCVASDPKIKGILVFWGYCV